MKNKLFILSSIISLLLSEESMADNKFYFGGGYQLSNLNFDDKIPKGSYTETEQVEVTDSENIVDNGDGSFTTTIESHYEDQEINKVGAYLNYDDYLKKQNNDFHLFSGIQLSKNQALELGFFYSESDKSNNNSNEYIFDGKTTKSQSKLQIISLDNILSTPIIDNVVNLNAIVGGSFIDYKSKLDLYENNVYSETTNLNQSGLGLNIGLGVETLITENISLRTSIKMILIPNGELFDNIQIGKIGIKISI